MDEKLILALLTESPTFRAHAAKTLAGLEPPSPISVEIQEIKKVHSDKGKIAAIKFLRKTAENRVIADKFVKEFHHLSDYDCQPISYWGDGSFYTLGLKFAKRIVENLME